MALDDHGQVCGLARATQKSYRFATSCDAAQPVKRVNNTWIPSALLRYNNSSKSGQRETSNPREGDFVLDSYSGDQVARTNIFILFVLLVCAMAAYFPSLSGNFVFDDHEALLNNPTVAELQWSDLLSSNWFTYARTFRPLTTASFMLEKQIFDFNPFVFRLNNILLHALSAFLLFLLARRFFDRIPAFACSLLFLLHPVLAENVNPVVGRAEILCTIFALLLVIVLLKFPQASKRVALAAALLYLCAILAKENGITLIVPALALIWFPDQRKGGRIASQAACTLSLIAVALAYLLYQRLLFGAFEGSQVPLVDNQLHELPRLEAWWAALGLQLNYLMHLSGFAGARADFTYPVTGIPPAWQGGAALLLLLAYALATWKVWKKKPGHLWMMLWYPATLSLASNMVILAYCIFAPRFLHLPLVGVMLLLAWGLQQVQANRRIARLAFAAVILLSLIWGAKVHLRSLDWQGDGTLFAADSMSDRATLRVDVTLATWLSEHRLIEAAEKQCVKMLPRIDSALRSERAWTKTDREFLANANSVCGRIQLKQGNPAAAQILFRKAYEIQPHGMFRFHLAQALAAQGETNQAVSVLEDLLQEPGEADRPDEEIRAYLESLKRSNHH